MAAFDAEQRQRDHAAVDAIHNLAPYLRDLARAPDVTSRPELIACDCGHTFTDRVQLADHLDEHQTHRARVADVSRRASGGHSDPTGRAALARLGPHGAHEAARDVLRALAALHQAAGRLRALIDPDDDMPAICDECRQPIHPTDRPHKARGVSFHERCYRRQRRRQQAVSPTSDTRNRWSETCETFGDISV